MVNPSKANDPRFWNKWRDNGAVWNIYSDCRTYVDLASIGVLKVLDETQRATLREYMCAHEGSKYYGKRAKFMRDFLKHPNQFKPNEFSLKSAYVDLVVRAFDEGELNNKRYVIFPTQITTDEINWGRMNNVEIKVGYGYSSTFGKNAAILEIFADVRKDSSFAWERIRSGGVAFSL